MTINQRVSMFTDIESKASNDVLCKERMVHNRIITKVPKITENDTTTYNDDLDMISYYTSIMEIKENTKIEKTDEEHKLGWITEIKGVIERYELELKKIKFFMIWKSNRKEYLVSSLHTLKVSLIEKEIEYDSFYGDEDIKEGYRQVLMLTKSGDDNE